MPKTITTDRLTLCAPMATDAAALACLISDWDVIKMLTRPPYPYRVADAAAFIASGDARPWEFAIYRGSDLIGMCGITDHLGYWLGKPYWGQGFMQEAARAVIDAYWAGTDTAQIGSGALAENRASQRTLKALGFHETGQRQVWSGPRNAPVAHIDMALPRPSSSQVLT